MGLIAAEELGVPFEKIDVVWGDTSLCPYSVGESGSRTTVYTGTAVVEAARDLKRQIADKGMPQGSDILSASATPEPVLRGAARFSFVAHFAEVEVDVETGHVRVTKYQAAHDSGRIMNPLTATSQVQGGSIQGIGMALHEELIYDRRSGHADHCWLLRRAVDDPPGRSADRRAVRRNRRCLRAVRREDAGRADHYSRGGRGGECVFQCHWTPH